MFLCFPILSDLCVFLSGMSATSLAVNEIALYRRGSVVLFSAMSPVPQGLELQSVFYVCCVLSDVASFFLLHSSCLKKLSLPIVGIKMCGGLFAKQVLLLQLSKLRSIKTCRLGDVVLEVFVLAFCGKFHTLR